MEFKRVHPLARADSSPLKAAQIDNLVETDREGGLKNMLEVNESIARAATSWNPAFPGRREVSRKEARQARAAMTQVRQLDIEPQ